MTTTNPHDKSRFAKSMTDRAAWESDAVFPSAEGSVDLAPIVKEVDRNTLATLRDEYDALKAENAQLRADLVNMSARNVEYYDEIFALKMAKVTESRGALVTSIPTL